MNYECVEVPFLHSNLGLLTLDIFFNRKVRKDLRKGRKVFFLPRTSPPGGRLHELSRIFKIFYRFVYYLLSSFHIFIKNKSLMLLLHKIT